MTAEPHGPYRPVEEVKEALKAALAEGRSPKSIRAALHPSDVPEFDREYRAAIAEAGETFDLKPVFDFQERWWATAMLKADPDEYAEMLRTIDRVTPFLERGESPPGAVRVDEAYKARMRDRIEHGK